MRHSVIVLSFTLVLTQSAAALPYIPAVLPAKRHQVLNLNRELAGQILDFTNHHDRDCRMYSQALCEKRSLYVYLPPGYDGSTSFPGMIWLHGFGQIDRNFLDIIPVIDKGIRTGRFPPCIIVAPDGSLHSRTSIVSGGSFYMNSKAGRFEDYVAEDVWGFVVSRFCVRPEREAHVLAGASMGGYGAYMLGFNHRETFGTIAGILPALDIRYADCHDRYMRPYDPNCVMERDHVRRQRVIARFYGVPVRERRLTDALLGKRHPDGLTPLAAVNPVEMLESLDIQPGEFAMFIGYGGKDEFNITAQVDHFLDVARRRGICPHVLFLPDGHHNVETGKKMIPDFAAWLSEVLAPYVPQCTVPLAHVGPSFELLTAQAKLKPACPLGLNEESGLWPRRAKLP